MLLFEVFNLLKTNYLAAKSCALKQGGVQTLKYLSFEFQYISYIAVRGKQRLQDRPSRGIKDFH